MIEPLPPFDPIIDPTAYIHPFTCIIGEVEIGAESSIWPGAILRGDDGLIRVGAQSSIQDGSVLHTTKDQSQAIVGDRVTMGHNVTFHGAICGSNSLIGMGSTVLDNARIGSHVLLGAGSLVPVGREIPDGVMAYGSPVRVVRDLSTEELDWIEFSWRIYVERAARYALRDADGDGDGDAGGEPGNRPPGAN